jgi:hypothetical protein
VTSGLDLWPCSFILLGRGLQFDDGESAAASVETAAAGAEDGAPAISGDSALNEIHAAAIPERALDFVLQDAAGQELGRSPEDARSGIDGHRSRSG